MNEFYSHSKESQDGILLGSKLLKTHTLNVLNIAKKQHYPKVNFEFSQETLELVIETLVKFHDLGKYSCYFQNYLLNIEPINHFYKQHARFGGVVAYNYLKNVDQKAAIISMYLIFLHHSKLIDIDDFAGLLNFDTKKIFEAQTEDIGKIISKIEDELNINDLLKYLIFPNDRIIRKFIKIWIRKKPNIQDYFLINYLFSLLIQADKLDASDTKTYRRKSINSDLVDKRFGQPEVSQIIDIDLNSISFNELRNFCRAEVISNLQKKDILDFYIFTLTAPTGIGKTMTALDFALKLKSKIAQKEVFEPQIIYALPFINIIEQALSEYNKTLSEDVRILGHYQYSDIFGTQIDSEEENYHQKLMKLDTWQGDIIITSFVQIFETIIGNRNKLLKKFNQLAGSIILLDEVQTLRLDHMPLIGVVLHSLTKFLKARVILMTATKPKIFELAENEIFSLENEKPKVLELQSSYNEIFSTFNRTSIQPLLYDLNSEEEIETVFVHDVFIKRWQTDKSCIIVCNTVNRSINLYLAIQKYLKSKELYNPLFHLSTNILPAHRLDIIHKIIHSIDQKISPILISTQVVEAGVDLDFDMGFRDLGPIDSIIQVAGRINRNNNPNKTNAPLYIVDFNDCKKIYGQLTYNQAKKALENIKVVLEKDYLQIINNYFNNISERSSFFTSREVFDSMKVLRYDSQNPKQDNTISSFKIIEDSAFYMSVFIEFDENARIARNKYRQLMEKEINQEQFAPFKRIFHQNIIAVPEYLKKAQEIKQLEWLLSENLWYVPFEEVNNYYDNQTGFHRTAEKEKVVCML